MPCVLPVSKFTSNSFILFLFFVLFIYSHVSDFFFIRLKLKLFSTFIIDFTTFFSPYFFYRIWIFSCRRFINPFVRFCNPLFSLTAIQIFYCRVLNPFSFFHLFHELFSQSFLSYWSYSRRFSKQDYWIHRCNNKTWHITKTTADIHQVCLSFLRFYLQTFF